MEIHFKILFLIVLKIYLIFILNFKPQALKKGYFNWKT